MTTKIKDVVADVNAVARSFKAVIALADKLEEIGSIETAEKEATRRLAAERQRETEAREQVAAALVELDKVKAKVKEAQGKAEQVIAEAQATADVLVANATEAGKAVVEAAEVEAADIKAKTKDAKTKLKAVEDELLERSKDLEVLNANIEKTKDKLRSLIG